MGWQPLGVAALNATSDEVTLGRLGIELSQGQLLVRLSTSAGGSIRPLAFGMVGFIDDDGIRSLGDTRYYPQKEPSVVSLGYGDQSAVTGRLTFRPRAYNLQWLRVGLPAAVWLLSAEVFVPAGVTAPAYSVAALADGAIQKTAQAVNGTIQGLKLAQVAWND